jgi:hypothetical protein
MRATSARTVSLVTRERGNDFTAVSYSSRATSMRL